MGGLTMQHVWARLRPSIGVLITGGAVVLAAGVFATPASAAPRQAAAPAGADAQVTVVHGVRGLLADVDVDGKPVLTSFSPERITDPLPLPPGKHKVQVRRHGDTTGAPIVAGTLTVPAGAHLTVAVGLNEHGNPVMTAYRDDDLANLLPDGKGSAIVVRDVADAPTLRVTAGTEALDPVVSPGQVNATVGAGTHTVAVKSASGGSTVLPPAQVPVQAGTVTALYLIGSTGDDSLDWLAQTIHLTKSGVQRHPVLVDTGNSGLAAEAQPARATVESGGSIGVAGTIGLSVAVLVGVGGALAVSRRAGGRNHRDRTPG